MDEPVATRYMRDLGGVRRNGAALMDPYIHTIQVLHLVLSIRGTTTLPAGQNRSLEQLAEPLHVEIPIFPPVACCAWPPNHVMDTRLSSSTAAAKTSTLARDAGALGARLSHGRGAATSPNPGPGLGTAEWPGCLRRVGRPILRWLLGV
jgi:hypothetical protein